MSVGVPVSNTIFAFVAFIKNSYNLHEILENSLTFNLLFTHQCLVLVLSGCVPRVSSVLMENIIFSLFHCRMSVVEF